MNGAGLIKKASTYLGEGWKRFCKAYGFSYPVAYCCIYVWYIFKVCKLSKLFYGGLKVCNCRTAFLWCLVHLKKVKMADAKAGDIVFFTWTGKGNNSFNPARSINHIGFIRKKGTSTTAYTIEGNTNSRNPAVSKVANKTREKAVVLGIFRPKYPTNAGLTDVVAYAKKRAKQHIKYRNNGPHSWTTYVNCTWFASNCFKDCGYKDVWKRMNTNKYYAHPNGEKNLRPYFIQKNEKGLNKSKLIPGDIVIRKTSTPHVWHTAIYIGNGKVAEAVKSGTRIGKLTKKFTYAFRIPKKKAEPKPTPKPTPKPKTKTVEHKATYEIVAKNGMNVRAKATKYSTRIGGIGKGKKVKTSKKHGNWVYVPALKGWLCIKSGNSVYLKKK